MTEQHFSPDQPFSPEQHGSPEANGVAADRAVIVVGYSAKPEGRAALRRALTEAELRSGRLIVVYTGLEPEPAELAADLAGCDITYEVAAPNLALDPAEELIAVADRTAAEFIVIGLRKRSPVGKLLLGSNAQRVFLDASCAVLAVKAE